MSNVPTSDPNWITGGGTYNYGSSTYDGEASIVEPPAGPVNDNSPEFANGFKPGAGVPVEVVNERFQALGQWISYFREGEFRNWQYLQNLASGSPAATKGEAIVWCAPHAEGGITIGQWLVAGYDATVSGALRSTDGKAWANDGPIGASAVSPDDIDARPDSNQVIAVSLGGVYFRRNTSEVWSGTTIAGQTFYQRIHWSASLGLWLMGTRQSVDTKAKICTSSDGSSWTERTLPGANATTITKWIASGNGKAVAIDDGATPKQWYSTNGTSWTEYSGFSAAITGAVRGLTYNAALGYFYLLTASRTYRSTDGQSWSDLGAHNATPVNRANCFCSHGKALVSADSSADTIMYSLDGGVTWKHAAFAQTGTKQNITGIASNGRQLAVVAYRAADTADVAVGFSFGSP